MKRERGQDGVNQPKTLNRPTLTHCEERSNPTDEQKDNADKVAFTLAEVLITLGIIGVVAAMTMPSLIHNSQKQETSARLKKFYSSMSQAMIFSEAENGLINDWGKPSSIFDEEGNYDPDANSQVSDGFFKKYIAPYIKYISAEKDANFSNYTKVIFTDGSTMHVRNGGCYDLSFDTNGDKKPNKTGRDKFWFLICPPDAMAIGYFNKGIHFGPYGPKSDSRDEVLASCRDNKDYCARLLQIDNWEIKDDYPGWK